MLRGPLADRATTPRSPESLDNGTRDCVVFAPVVPEHLDLGLWTAIVDANEEHIAA
jgi:hypothetical protein